MKYLSLAQILQPCVGQGWAVGGYDTCNLEITQAIVNAAAADQAPAIIMIYPSHTPQTEWPTLTRIIEAEVERTRIPVALVLDHAKTIDQIRYALDLGFSGVMIDASLAPLDQNIALTRQAVELAHAHGVSVEAELGHVGEGQDIIGDDQQQAHLTRVDEAERFARETGVDALAVSIGTLHGLYRGTPKLDFDRLAQIRSVCPIPLVLHGGSDTPSGPAARHRDRLIRSNIWTDVRIPFLRTVKEALSGLERSKCTKHLGRALMASEVIRRKNGRGAQLARPAGTPSACHGGKSWLSIFWVSIMEARFQKPRSLI
jgi:fructose-bisphosphate aldolase class II